MEPMIVNKYKGGAKEGELLLRGGRGFVYGGLLGCFVCVGDELVVTITGYHGNCVRIRRMNGGDNLKKLIKRGMGVNFKDM